jgi:geranylgeranyl pyrophosphate synthase
MDNTAAPPIDYRTRLRPEQRLKKSERCERCAAMPHDPGDRKALRLRVRSFVERHGLVAPLDWDELRERTRQFMTEENQEERVHDFLLTVVSNEAWRPILRKIPYDKRVLLMPQCLRDPKTCPAEIDDFGLLCEECGRCPIGPLQNLAESLGYSVVVAEGTTLVTELIEQGTVQAVVGVSCLPVLERAYPHMTSHAVPGVAVPLLREGCVKTEVDEEWLREMLLEIDPMPDYQRLDLATLRAEVKQWFTTASLHRLLGEPHAATERYAQAWLAEGGKRWRPLLTVAAYLAITGKRVVETDALRKLAIAVECFHKASLAHDDIEDDEAERYGKPTLHRQYDLSIALNIGDYLQGEGYRLLAEAGFEPARTAAMIVAAARGHCELSLGQGEELRLRFENAKPDVAGAVEIMRRKTAPAFSVALLIGAHAAGADAATCAALQLFSAHLGTAYQIRDDLHDVVEGETISPKPDAAVSVITLLAEQAACEKGLAPAAALEEARFRGEQLLEQHRFEAVCAIRVLTNCDLKSILHRLITKILPYG